MGLIRPISPIGRIGRISPIRRMKQLKQQLKKQLGQFKQLSFKRQVLFVAVGLVVITTGVLVTLAVNNRGADPTLWLKMDEGVGTSAYDASGSGNTASITNALWKQEAECKFGKCLYFDGRGDYLTVADNSSIEPTAGLTLEAWVKPNKFATSSDYTSSTDSIFYKASQYGLDIINGMPRFRAYANSTWYSVQAGETASDVGAATFRETFDGSLYEGSPTFTPAFGYRALTPANLTAKKGVLITQSDNLQYSRGSQATPDGTNVAYENFDPNQGSLEFWVKPNWNGDDGVEHEILIGYVDSGNYIYLYKYTNNILYFQYRGSSGTAISTQVSATGWAAGTWYHVVAVWDKNNTVNGSNYSYLYVNGSGAGSVTAVTAMTSVPSLFFIGQSNNNTLQFNGTIAGRILNRPLSSTEVTALYNSGAGSTDTFTVTPDTIWMGDYSD